jgi:hypothetical protein
VAHSNKDLPVVEDPDEDSMQIEAFTEHPEIVAHHAVVS